MSPAQRKPDLDLDEDLFDFAGIEREPDPVESEEDLEQIFASFRDVEQEEDLLAVPQAPSAPAHTAPTHAAPIHAAERAPGANPDAAPDRAARPATSAAPEASSTLARRTPAPEPAARAPEASGERVPAARSSRFTKGVVAVAAAVTLLNSVVAVVVLRGRSSDHDVRAVAPEAAPEAGAHEPAAHAASHTPSVIASGLPEPERVGTLPDHPALDEARRQISHGEYGAARRRVYGLLSIIDRLEDPRRGALEADCQFLIAQSLHLEALARMGGSE